MSTLAQRRRSSWARRLMIVSVIAVVAIVAAFAFAPTVLCVDSGPVTAEVIVVLGGDSRYRPERAAQLFNSQSGKLVIVSGDGDCEISMRALENAGVPKPAIVLECESGSTKENAEFSVRILRIRSVRKAIVVTSWFHSRRALKSFQAAAPEIEFSSRPAYYGMDRTGWNSNGIRVHICDEYVKLLYYWVRYGVAPV